MSTVDVVVTVDDAHAGRLSEVTARLQAAGMTVKGTLDAIGTVTGSVEEARLGALAGIEGVEHIERSRQYRLAPPDSPIQ